MAPFQKMSSNLEKKRGSTEASKYWGQLGQWNSLANFGEEERKLWDAIPSIQDLQCAWQLVVQSANPRANHMLRTLPPSLPAGT